MTKVSGRGKASVSFLSRIGVLSPLALACSLIWGWAAWVCVGVLGDSTQRLVEAENQYQAAKNERLRLEEQRSQSKQVKQALQDLDFVWRALPMENEFSSLALAVSELGRAEGVTIPGMTYALKSRHEGQEAVEATLSFQASGPYLGIYRFIRQLERSESYMVIERLNVRSESSSLASSSGTVLFDVMLTTFLKPSGLKPGMS